MTTVWMARSLAHMRHLWEQSREHRDDIANTLNHDYGMNVTGDQIAEDALARGYRRPAISIPKSGEKVIFPDPSPFTWNDFDPIRPPDNLVRKVPKGTYRVPKGGFHMSKS